MEPVGPAARRLRAADAGGGRGRAAAGAGESAPAGVGWRRRPARPWPTPCPAGRPPARPLAKGRGSAPWPVAKEGREAILWAAATAPAFAGGLAVLQALAAWPPRPRLALAVLAML